MLVPSLKFFFFTGNLMFWKICDCWFQLWQQFFSSSNPKLSKLITQDSCIFWNHGLISKDERSIPIDFIFSHNTVFFGAPNASLKGVTAPDFAKKFIATLLFDPPMSALCIIAKQNLQMLITGNFVLKSKTCMNYWI